MASPTAAPIGPLRDAPTTPSAGPVETVSNAGAHLVGATTYAVMALLASVAGVGRSELPGSAGQTLNVHERDLWAWSSTAHHGSLGL